MSMLCIARDYLPSVLTGSGQISDEMEKNIDAHFSDIATFSGRNAKSSQSSDWWMPFVIGLDVILVFGGLGYFIFVRRQNILMSALCNILRRKVRQNGSTAGPASLHRPQSFARIFLWRRRGFGLRLS